VNRWHFIFILVLFGGGSWLWLTRTSDNVAAEDRSPQPALYHPAPDLTLPALDGTTFSLAALDGKPAILNFWATWCAPCRAEMPMLQAAWERYNDSVAIVGVDIDEDPALVQAFVDELDITFPILLDEGAVIAGRYNVRGLPTTLFIDGDGIIRQIYPGQLHSAIQAEGIVEIIR
jgi:thiol-disulfide isomerase/thioredoxin